MTHEFRLTAESDEDGRRDPPDVAAGPVREGNQVGLFVLALAVSLGVGAIVPEPMPTILTDSSGRWRPWWRLFGPTWIVR